MQESTIDEGGTVAEEPSRAVGIKGILSTAIGAVVAVALLLALGVWFYRLGVRDAQNVPIIRAALDPVKVRPEDPGGTETPHQDITSYQVAESEPVQSAATVIAPAPPEPRPEDVAMAELNETSATSSGTATQTSANAGPASVTTTVTTDISELSDDDPETLQQQIDREVVALLSQSAGNASSSSVPAADEGSSETTGETATNEVAVTNTINSAPDVEATTEDAAPAPDEDSITDGTTFAPSASPTAPRRPQNLLARVEEAKKEEERSVSDLASRAAKSRVQVQLAADPDESAIRQQWRRIYNANSDVLRDRTLAVQQTISGGTTFYRLRVGPFETTSEARAVCQALKARGQDCIVARNG